jgi:hypothetical protein
MIPYLLAVVGGYLLGDSMKDIANGVSKMAKGGKTKDMSIQFIDYKDKTIMFEPHYKEYFTNDIQFKSLADAKKYIDAGSPDPSWEKFAYSQGIMADGGVANQCALEVADAEVEVVKSDFRKETMELSVDVEFYIEKLDIYATKVYMFDLYVDEDGYAISSIFYEGKKVSKEESNMLEDNKIISNEVENAYVKEFDTESDEDYADGGATKKEYLFNFVSGGWNSISANTKREAIKLAKKKYEDSKSKVDEKSFRIKTKKDYDTMMRMFN